MTINRKERLWACVGSEGTYAVFTLHDTVDITEAVDGGETAYIKLDPSKNLVDQVVSIGLTMNGEGDGEYGYSAASYARVITLSAGGKRFPEENDIEVKSETGTIQFGHIIPREGVLIEDTRGNPKVGAPLEEKWVCATRCGIKQHVMKKDVVVATPLRGGESFTGKIIYDKGNVLDEWLGIVPRLQPSRTDNLFSHNSPVEAAPVVKG